LLRLLCLLTLLVWCGNQWRINSLWFNLGFMSTLENIRPDLKVLLYHKNIEAKVCFYYEKVKLKLSVLFISYLRTKTLKGSRIKTCTVNMTKETCYRTFDKSKTNDSLSGDKNDYCACPFQYLSKIFWQRKDLEKFVCFEIYFPKKSWSANLFGLTECQRTIDWLSQKRL
jgi:hypothetical protein